MFYSYLGSRFSLPKSQPFKCYKSPTVLFVHFLLRNPPPFHFRYKTKVRFNAFEFLGFDVQVAAVLNQYIEAVQVLFENHKSAAGYPNTSLTVY